MENAQEVAELALKSSPWLADHPTPLDAKAIVKIFKESF